MNVPLPENEAERLDALHKLNIMHSPPSDDFDAIALLASETLKCPISLVTFIDDKEQWFKARCGIDDESTSREVAFCSHTILTSKMLVVPDTHKSKKFSQHPLVVAGPKIRAYAGFPLSLDGNLQLGTLCVADTKPRRFTEHQLHLLEILAKMTVSLVQAHEHTFRISKLANTLSTQTIRMQTMFENFPGGVALYDKSRRLVAYNEHLKDLLDLDENFLSSRPSFEEYFRMNAKRGEYGTCDVDKMVKDRLSIMQKNERHQSERIRPNGTVLEIRGVPIQGGGYVSTYTDVTERKQIELKLREQERKAREKTHELEVMLHNMKQGVSVYDSETRLTLWNQQYIDLYRKPPIETMAGMTFRELVDYARQRGTFESDVVSDIDEMQERLRNGETIRVTFRSNTGRLIASLHAPTPDGGWVATHEDITEQEAAAERIQYAAHHDTLTGLANRAYFNKEIESAVLEAAEGEIGSALMMIDLDRFKAVNDSFGHGTGDRLLMAVGDRISSCTREGDLVCRLGGDEFAVIFRGLLHSEQTLSEIATRIVTKLATPFCFDNKTIQIGASVGISIIPNRSPNIEAILNAADRALYEVKRSGRNGFRFGLSSPEASLD